MVAAAVTAAVALVVTALMIRLEWRYSHFVSPGGAPRRLRRSPTGSFSTELRGIGWAWDPTPWATRGVSIGRIYGPGRATYELVAGADGALVRLTLHRRDGSTYESEGPVPPQLVAGTPEKRTARRIKRVGLLLALLYPIAGVVG
jgi:hypothetical protein